MQPQIILSSQDKRRTKVPISSGPQPVCSACRTQYSRYTCPKCNFHYCSLVCFRSPAHESCSEAFDRQSLMDDIHRDPTKTAQEKHSMIDMLRKFEEESLAEDEARMADETADAEQEDLERRLQGVDLDALSSDDLMALLSDSQRKAFESTLKDPSKISALVTSEFEIDPPWWEVDADIDSLEERVQETHGHDEGTTEEINDSCRPQLIGAEGLPPLKVDENGNTVVNPRLIYNIAAVLFAYSYVLRTFSLESFNSLPIQSTERFVCIDMLKQLVPFLIERSVLVFDNADAAVEDVVAREQPDTITPALLALLLGDVGVLLEPTTVAAIPDDTDHVSSLVAHPFVTTLAALSDVHHLFSTASDMATAEERPIKPSLIQRPSSTSKRPRRTYHGATQKLAFYISFLASPRSPMDSRKVASVARRFRKDSEIRQREVQERDEAVHQTKEQLDQRKKSFGAMGTQGVGERPRIVELE